MIVGGNFTKFADQEKVSEGELTTKWKTNRKQSAEKRKPIAWGSKGNPQPGSVTNTSA